MPGLPLSFDARTIAAAALIGAGLNRESMENVLASFENCTIGG